MRRGLAAVLAAACLLAAALGLGGAALADAFPPSSTPLMAGIDVSSWQRAIDWARVRAAGIEVAMLRASEGDGFIDPYFDANYAGAKAAGVKVGFYHYLTAQTAAEAVAQADHFAATIAGKTPDCLLALDYGGGGSLSGEALTANAAAFLARVEAVTGYGAMLYTDAWAAKARYGAAVTAYSIWVANYGVPSPEPNGQWASWVGFQYSDRGVVDGISGAVDRDWFTAQVFQGGGPTPTPTSTPTPEPTPTPTSTPTPPPTPEPTSTPTCEPTHTPTPTCAPTPEPTPTPTCGPTPTPAPGAETLYYQPPLDIGAEAAAALLDTTARELLALNDLVGGVVQAGQVARYPSRVASSGEAFAGLHVLQADESLHTLARRYGVPVDSLMALNAFAGGLPPTGQIVRLPDAPGRADVPAPPSWLLENVAMLRPGQTLEGLAAQYSVPADTLRTINGIAGRIYPGQLLHLQAYGNDETPAFRGGYVVQRGDSLVRIARRFGTTAAALYRLNNITTASLIYPGQILLLPE